jgi:hypothetical protein
MLGLAGDGHRIRLFVNPAYRTGQCRVLAGFYKEAVAGEQAFVLVM